MKRVRATIKFDVPEYYSEDEIEKALTELPQVLYNFWGLALENTEGSIQVFDWTYYLGKEKLDEARNEYGVASAKVLQEIEIFD